jgi:transposase
LKAAQTEVSGSTASLEGPEEIDMSHEHDDESHKVAEAKRKAEAQRMSQYIKFEKASASDFKDLDALLKELDEMYVKKKRQDPSNNHEAESVSNKLQPPPRNTVAQNVCSILLRLMF